MSVKRSRQWSFLVYQDSGDLKQTEEIICRTGFQAFRSPLHDKDRWTEEDEKENPEHSADSLKKAHYHWLIIYPNPRAMKSTVELFQSVGVQYAEPVTSISGMWDYFTHKNTPEKHQYEGEPTSYNGFSIADYRTQTKADTRRTIYALLDYIKSNEVTSVTDLLVGLLSRQDIPEYNEMSEYVQKNVLLVREFVRDSKNEITGDNERVKMAKETRKMQKAKMKKSDDVLQTIKIDRMMKDKDITF